MKNQNDPHTYTKGFLLGALVGGAVGAITALLLAPKSGSELRKDIAQTSQDLYGKASDYFQTVEANVERVVANTVNEGKIKAQGIIESARRQAGNILENAENVLKDARSKASSTKEVIEDNLSNLKNAAKAGADAFKAEMSASKQEYHGL